MFCYTTEQERFMDSLTELFCLIDDFCQSFEPTSHCSLLVTLATIPICSGQLSTVSSAFDAGDC
jgi:hypothetical protein